MPHANMPSLQTLDVAVLGNIMKHLLDAQHVKAESDSCLCARHTFAFQPAILRTCKRLHSIGSRVFRGNHFIRFDSPSHCLIGALASGPRLKTWHNNINSFTNYQLRVNIVEADNQQNGQTVHSFLVCLEDLNPIVHILRVRSAIGAIGDTFSFNVSADIDGTPLGLRLQRQLLEPFQTNQGAYNSCLVSGTVDTVLAQKTQVAITTSFLWTRARSWTFIDQVTQMKGEADSAITRGCFVHGREKHQQLSNVINDFEMLRHELLRSGDLALSRHWLHLDCVVQLNSAIAYIRHCWNSMDVNNLAGILNGLVHLEGHSQDSLSKEEQAMLSFLSAIGYGLLRRDTTSMQRCFAKAVELVPIKRYRDAAAIGTKIFNAIANHPHAGIEHFVNNLMQSIPKKMQLKTPLKDELSLSAGIDMERHVLRGLGYPGDLLLDKVKQKEGYSIDWDHKHHEMVEKHEPFNVELADRFIKDMRTAQQAHDPKLTQGRPFVGYIEVVNLETGLQGVVRGPKPGGKAGYDHYHIFAHPDNPCNHHHGDDEHDNSHQYH